MTTMIRAYEPVTRRWIDLDPGVVAAHHYTTTDGVEDDGSDRYVNGRTVYSALPDGSASIRRVIMDGVLDGPVIEDTTETIPAGEWVLVPGSDFGARSGTWFVQRGRPEDYGDPA